MHGAVTSWLVVPWPALRTTAPGTPTASLRSHVCRRAGHDDRPAVDEPPVTPTTKAPPLSAAAVSEAPSARDKPLPATRDERCAASLKRDRARANSACSLARSAARAGAGEGGGGGGGGAARTCGGRAGDTAATCRVATSDAAGGGALATAGTACASGATRSTVSATAASTRQAPAALPRPQQRSRGAGTDLATRWAAPVRRMLDSEQPPGAEPVSLAQRGTARTQSQCVPHCVALLPGTTMSGSRGVHSTLCGARAEATTVRARTLLAATGTSLLALQRVTVALARLNY